jgi:5,5'-dehydrodivanillate O-demethylase
MNEAQYSRDDFRDFAHTGPGTLAGSFMRRFWHPVWVADELPPGHAQSVKLMGEEFTLFRGATGKLHAVGHRCPHRGTILSVGWVEDDCIRCLYHGWKFDHTGQCVEQPGEGKGYAEKVKIASYPVDEYLGLVFVYLGEGEAPPLPRYPQFDDEGVLDIEWYARKCNFFQNLENGVDEAHVYFTHRAVQFSGEPYDQVIPVVEAEETEYGIIQYGIRKNGEKRVTHLIVPNILNMRLPARVADAKQWNKYISWRVPVDDENHKSFIVQLVHVSGEAAERFRNRQKAARERLAQFPPVEEVSDAILAGKMRLADVKDHPGIINIQDNVTQLGQRAIVDRKGERLGRTDAAVILLRSIWERELRAIAENRAPTEWKFGTRLDAVGV